jgi:asparagine synthase (glutamine-hydrolysing)
MCGICGQYNFGDGAPVQRDTVERMARSIAHRGPDDEGYFIAGPLGLGFRRLSIIDLSGGHQPMSDVEEAVYVIFNGEIYNFPELRKELEGFGHIFRTHSDTEVIIHGYKQWGDEVLNHLNGMFGLAIWDVRKQRLIVARDPFGIKLVYYKLEHGRLFFGSEIRAVVAGLNERIDVDPQSVSLFLRYRYTPSPHTIFKGVLKLAPGTMLVCESGKAEVRRWYNFRPGACLPLKSQDEACEELFELYKQSIKRHLLSDVPVGLLLSGGVDSGLLLGLMNLYGGRWKTYTVGYGKSFGDDELVDAQRTASRFSSEHTSLMIDRPTFEDNLLRIVSQLEEPVASSSVVPMYFVCKRAREDVKVALVGQGPDELFAGYPRHLGVRYGSYWRSVPTWMRAPVETTIPALPRNEMLKRGLRALKARDPAQRYREVLSLLPGNEIYDLFQDDVVARDADDGVLECWRELLTLSSESDELGRFQFIEMRSSLPDELLMYSDKLSMAHGLEVRVPYLDKEIVEFAERLPANFKVRYGRQKWIHRRVCKKFLDSEMLKRKKRGFAGNVVDDWFRSAVASRMRDNLMDPQSYMYKFLRPAAVQRVLREHEAGRNDHYKILFSLSVFEEWLRVQSSRDVGVTPELSTSR